MHQNNQLTKSQLRNTNTMLIDFSIQVNLKSGDSYACISLSLALSYCGDPLSHQTGHMTTICAKGNTTITKLAVVGTTTLNYNHPQDHQFWNTKGEPIFCIPKLAHLLCSTHTHTQKHTRACTHTQSVKGGLNV